MCEKQDVEASGKLFTHNETHEEFNNKLGAERLFFLLDKKELRLVLLHSRGPYDL
jgi:hypothetical protein